MPRMYQPRLTAEECRTLDWPTFRDRLQPFDVIPLGSNLEVAFIDKTSLWAPADLCSFLGGNKDVSTIEDLTIEEGKKFLDIHQKIIKCIQNLGNIHRDQYGLIHMAFGFNPEDFVLGSHSIKRLHTHIFTPQHFIINGNAYVEPLRQETPWRKLSWFDRLKFVEPFVSIYFDFIEYWMKKNTLQISNFLSREKIKKGDGYISFFIKDVQFADFFPLLQALYKEMHAEYSKVEALFTNRVLDSESNRFLPRRKKDRIDDVAAYIERNSWLSSQSKDIISYVAANLRIAESRKSSSISTAAQAWFTKGFAGTLMFAFDRSAEVKFDFFPRVITSSAPEKAIYGDGQPTLINRSERQPNQLEKFEIEKFLLAVRAAVKDLHL